MGKFMSFQFNPDTVGKFGWKVLPTSEFLISGRSESSAISIVANCQQWKFNRQHLQPTAADLQMNKITNDLSENNMVDACN